MSTFWRKLLFGSNYDVDFVAPYGMQSCMNRLRSQNRTQYDSFGLTRIAVRFYERHDRSAHFEVYERTLYDKAAKKYCAVLVLGTLTKIDEDYTWVTGEARFNRLPEFVVVLTTLYICIPLTIIGLMAEVGPRWHIIIFIWTLVGLLYFAYYRRSAGNLVWHLETALGRYRASYPILEVVLPSDRKACVERLRELATISPKSKHVDNSVLHAERGIRVQFHTNRIEKSTQFGVEWGGFGRFGDLRCELRVNGSIEPQSTAVTLVRAQARLTYGPVLALVMSAVISFLIIGSLVEGAVGTDSGSLLMLAALTITDAVFLGMAWNRLRQPRILMEKIENALKTELQKPSVSAVDTESILVSDNAPDAVSDSGDMEWEACDELPVQFQV